MKKIATFDDWIDLFRQWQEDIGVDCSLISDYRFEAKFGDLDSPEIEFGAFAGERKWEAVLQIPYQRIRDALLNYLIVQGDTEFASVEQQRHLITTAPNDYDRRALIRIMTEEMRHGWQMSYLLCSHFGDEGKREAAKLLERRADEGERLLGSFNEIVDNWLDSIRCTPEPVFSQRSPIREKTMPETLRRSLASFRRSSWNRPAERTPTPFSPPTHSRSSCACSERIAPTFRPDDSSLKYWTRVPGSGPS